MAIFNLQPLHPQSQDSEAVHLDAETFVAPDQFIEEYETTKEELRAYWAYNVGNSGIGLFQFAQTAFQNQLSQAAESGGTLWFAGAYRTVDSIVLLANCISFAIQIVLFFLLGSFADFGRRRPYILVIMTMVAVIIGMAWLKVHSSGDWKVAAALYIVGPVAYHLAYAFWFAAFPGLARNMPEMRESAGKLNRDEITRQEYDKVDSVLRNYVCNMGLYISGLCEMPLVAIGIGILYLAHSNRDAESNIWGLSLLIVWTSICWLVLAVPWFVWEKNRPGQPLPPGKNIVTAGLWQICRASTQVWRLKQTVAYLVGFFLLSGAVNTTVTVVNILQSAVSEYNIIILCALLIVGLAGQTVGIYVFMKIQERWRLSTKTMLNIVAISIIVLDLYGMIGIWSDKAGFHHEWEFWLYQVWYGIMICPWYSYSQTMISEVIPRNKECLFFALFNIIGKTSSFLGPLVSSLIVDATPSKNKSTTFYFLFGLTVVSCGIIAIHVDVRESQKEQEKFLCDERKAWQASGAESC